jgi:hypothetical protein
MSISLVLGLIGLAEAATIVILWLILKSTKAKLSQAEADRTKQADMIKVIQEVYSEASKLKASLSTGTDTSKFDASLVLLHKLAGKPAGP